MGADRVAALAGAYSLAMILGALGFQYVGGILPCEMCHWQRWPHDAAIVLGLGGAVLYQARLINRDLVRIFAWLALAAIAATALIGLDQALVEWKLLPGPSSCTGQRFVPTGNLNLNLDDEVVPCDVVQWQLFGISLAGYNFLCSMGAAILGTLLLTRRIVVPARWLPKWARET